MAEVGTHFSTTAIDGSANLLNRVATVRAFESMSDVELEEGVCEDARF